MIFKLKRLFCKRQKEPKMIEGLNAWYSPRYYFVSRGYVWLVLDDSNKEIRLCKIVDIAV